MADYVSGEEKCGVPATPRCEARRDVDADTVRGYATFRCGLPIGHPGSHQAERVAGGPLIWEQSAEPLCGVVRIVEEMNGTVAYTCARAVRHDGEHKDRDGAHWLGKGPILWPSEKLCGVPYLLKSSDSGKCHLAAGHDGEHKNGTGRSYSTAMAAVKVAEHTPGKRSDDEIDKMVNGLRRKVRAQANQINKLEELRRARAKSGNVGSAERERRFVDRFYRLAALLTDDTAGETWDTLLQRVADLKAELEVERVRANARKAELTKQDVARLLMGSSAKYGTTPLAARVAELAKDQDSVSRVVAVLNERLSKLETGAVSRCESRHGDQRCVMFVGHMGPHHAGPGAERWV